jgi:propanediol utilization protein
MGMSEADAERIDGQLAGCPNVEVSAVLDQLWLRTALIVARNQVRVAERDAFNARADRALARVGP